MWTWPAFDSTVYYNLGRTAETVSNDITQSPDCGYTTSSYTITTNSQLASMISSDTILSIENSNPDNVGTQIVTVQFSTNDPNNPTLSFPLTVIVICSPTWTWTDLDTV